MASSSTWRRYRTAVEWPDELPVAFKDRLNAFIRQVQEAIAQVETALADCTTGDLIAVVGTERVRRTNDGSYPPVQVAARLYAKWGDEPDRARLAIWTAALDLTLEHEAPAVQTVVLNLLLERAFRALIAADPPRDTDAALTGLAAMLEVEVQHVLADVVSQTVPSNLYRVM